MMAKKVVPLTDAKIRSCSAKAKQYSLADGNGLYLRIWPNNSKTWVFNYTHPITKKRVNLGFGKYPEVPLAQARTKREQARQQIALGKDPQSEAKIRTLELEEKRNNTFEKVSLDWLKTKKSEFTADYHIDVTRSLERHLYPSIGQLPIHAITKMQVIQVLKPIDLKGNLETVKRLCQRINSIMTYAENTGLIENNTFGKIQSAFSAPEKKNYPTLKPEQLPELMHSLNRASISFVTRKAIEFQLHTMTRPNETARAEWSEIDFENKLWKIPAEKMKKRREHIIPLTEETIAILNDLIPISGDRQYIFISDRNPNTHINLQTPNMAIKRMGFHKKLVAHGLRSIGSTTLNEKGFEPDLIETALAHLDSNGVRAAYNHANYVERRRPMMEWWSTHIAECSIPKTIADKLKPFLISSSSSISG